MKTLHTRVAKEGKMSTPYTDNRELGKLNHSLTSKPLSALTETLISEYFRIHVLSRSTTYREQLKDNTVSGLTTPIYAGS